MGMKCPEKLLLRVALKKEKVGIAEMGKFLWKYFPIKFSLTLSLGFWRRTTFHEPWKSSKTFLFLQIPSVNGIRILSEGQGFSPGFFRYHVASERVKRRRTTLRIYADKILTSDTLLSVLLPFFLCLPLQFSILLDVNGKELSVGEKAFREAARFSGANVYLFDFWQQEHNNVVWWRHDAFIEYYHSRGFSH